MASEYQEYRRYTHVAAYQQSKLVQRMMTRALALPLCSLGVTVNCCHPGVATTELLKTLGVAKGWVSLEEAAETPVFLAMSEEVKGRTGQFFIRKAEKECKWSNDPKAVEDLWRVLRAFLPWNLTFTNPH